VRDAWKPFGKTCSRKRLMDSCGSSRIVFQRPGPWIAATQSDAKREPHAGHDPIAVTDTRTTLDKVQLEAAHPSAVAVSGERLTQVVNRWQL
jgi:hypothetical protein